ncbi:hypothetical protein [Bradyrhizobium canariense]|uniref:Uncharacterized protein n=1 Tax=Bradyrhizobium canariense TaxID=255045 RepID=A0A1H1XGL6_9BRAD|nr:hypothetical protein [Bradyrhizobium canariense]SDT08262.1 hypothetical protein SAMN05444158_4313 [Bradyrhizobium canariense]
MLDRRAFLATAGAILITDTKSSLAQTTPSKALRVVVIANRYHEADGLMAAICNQMAHSPNLSAPYNVDWPRWPRVLSNPPAPPKDSGMPRCLIDVFRSPSDKTPTATMEIWCIDDLANTNGVSSAKISAMDQITNFTKPPSTPDGVIAFGTAGYPGLPSNNGCATIGGTIFIHDASNGAAGGWSWPGNMDMLIPSKIPASFFSSVAADQEALVAINLEMISPQNHPASVLQLIIAADAVGISSVNIPAGAQYCDVDTNSIGQALSHGAKNIASVETTHGVIRSKWPDAPFVFVTAIPNRVCHFPDEASGIYAQEFASSHNAGVALKHVIPYFVSAIA